MTEKEAVDHPPHYGGADNPHEPIKVIKHYKLGFNIGNTVKYLLRAGKKDDVLQDLKKAQWYLDDEIKDIEAEREARRKRGEEPFKTCEPVTGTPPPPLFAPPHPPPSPGQNSLPPRIPIII